MTRRHVGALLFAKTPSDEAVRMDFVAPLTRKEMEESLKNANPPSFRERTSEDEASRQLIAKLTAAPNLQIAPSEPNRSAPLTLGHLLEWQEIALAPILADYRDQIAHLRRLIKLLEVRLGGQALERDHLKRRLQRANDRLRYLEMRDDDPKKRGT